MVLHDSRFVSHILKLIKLNNETRRYESYDGMTFAHDQITGHGFRTCDALSAHDYIYEL